MGGDKYKVVDYFDCYQLDYETQYDEYSASYVVTDYTVTGYDGEGRAISAIKYVALDNIPKLYNITGHDEIEISESLAGRLDKSNMLVENINLLTYDKIPDDAAAIFVLGPLSDYSDEEVAKINAYLEKGGNAIFTVAYTDAAELDKYYSIFEPYNISVAPGLIMEQGSSYYNAQQYFLLPDIVKCDVTDGIYTNSRKKYVYMPYAKGMILNDTYGDVDTQVLLQTTENAYAATDTLLSEGEGEAADTACYVLGVTATKYYPDCKSHIMVLGSDLMLSEEIDAAVNGNNLSLFMNGLNSMIGLEDTTVIPMKIYSYPPVIINETAVNIYSVLLIVILPVALVLTGFIIWFDRKRA